MTDTQTPGGWPDAAYITAVADAVFDATGLVLGYVTAAEMARFVQAREAAARREGIEAAAHAAETCLHPSAERTAHAAVDDAVAAIRALLEAGR